MQHRTWARTKTLFRKLITRSREDFMQFRARRPYAVVLLTIVLAGCSGSSGGGDPLGPDCASGGGNAFCLTTCNLGCSLAGCTINAIAQNQPIFLKFNQDVDPNSINSGSVSIRTATGAQPRGRLVVNGSVVQFVPDVLISGAQTFFGFDPGATYSLHLPSGSEVNVVRSTRGDRLGGSITCSLQVTRGIIDLNEACPQAKLVTPANTTSAPTDTVIVLRFNEILDPAPFIGATEENKPIRFFVKKTQETSPGSGVFVCRGSSEAVELAGQPRVEVDPARQETVVTFQPQEELPGNHCVEILVTARALDLAGVEACPQTLTFVTENIGVQERTVVEDFANDTTLDKVASAGSWSANKVTFAKIGGDGVLGEFDHESGRDLGNDQWEWSTDGGTTIPRTKTLDGQDHTITNGVFSFSTFVLPAGITVNFVGKNPLQINVRGEMKILGKLLCNGVDLKRDAHKGDVATGEPGSPGGPGGARGGNGADRGDGDSNKSNFNGQDGQDALLPSGHAYTANVGTTGGFGSKQWPADGKQATIKFSLFGVICAMATPGGGGGGNLLAGGPGTGIWRDSQGKPNTALNAEVGPAPLGGTKLGWDPIKPTSAKSLEHHQVGAAGGAGCGSHPLGAIIPTSGGDKISFRSGRAGAGGGGAVAIRCGYQLTMTGSGLIQARGGNASPNLSEPFSSKEPGPGGGGGGGTILFQVDGTTDM
ncbi:MAG: Ig-like domain-containing domain, partial [Planctomycetota bacterium]